MPFGYELRATQLVASVAVVRVRLSGRHLGRMAVERQADGKTGAVPRCAFDIDAAAVHFHQRFHQRQAEPAAFIGPGQATMQLHEWLEEERKLVGLDTDTGVADGQLDAPFMIAEAN